MLQDHYTITGRPNGLYNYRKISEGPLFYETKAHVNSRKFPKILNALVKLYSKISSHSPAQIVKLLLIFLMEQLGYQYISEKPIKNSYFLIQLNK